MANQKQHLHSVLPQRENNSLLIQFILYELYQASIYISEYISLIEQIQLTPNCKYGKKGKENLKKFHVPA